MALSYKKQGHQVYTIPTPVALQTAHPAHNGAYKKN